MRLVIAMMKHETNTFSPVPTPLARFARGGTAPLYWPAPILCTSSYVSPGTVSGKG